MVARAEIADVRAQLRTLRVLTLRPTQSPHHFPPPEPLLPPLRPEPHYTTTRLQS